MRDQIIELSERPLTPAQTGRQTDDALPASYPEAAFWLHVYPPLGDRKAPLLNAQMVCPWTLAAELADDTTPATRRQNVLEALKRGLKTIRQYGLPAYRILFTREFGTGMVNVWVD